MACKDSVKSYGMEWGVGYMRQNVKRRPRLAQFLPIIYGGGCHSHTPAPAVSTPPPPLPRSPPPLFHKSGERVTGGIFRILCPFQGGRASKLSLLPPQNLSTSTTEFTRLNKALFLRVIRSIKPWKITPPVLNFFYPVFMPFFLKRDETLDIKVL